MINIGNVEIENFLRIKSAKFSLKNQGLVLLKGNNKDEPAKASSGSGKTLFGDALMWLFGGITSRKIPVDSVIGKGDKYTHVSAQIFKDGTKYDIDRYRKHPKYGSSLSLNSGNDLTHRKVMETEGRLSQILGYSFDLFRASSFVSGDSKYQFSRMDVNTRAKILDEIINTDESDISKRYKTAGES